MRRGSLALPLVALLAVAAAAAFLLQPSAITVVADGGSDDEAAVERGASALAASGRAAVAATPTFAGDATGTLVGTVRRGGKPAPASLAVHLRTRPRPGQPLDDVVEVGDGAVPPEASDEGPLLRVDVGADGAFRLVVPAPAAYVVVATDAEGARGRGSARLGAVGARAVVDVDLLLGTERLVGRAVHADGRPFQGSVAARRAADHEDFLTLAPTRTEADGRFALEGLVQGPHTLVAFVPGRFAASTRTVVVPRDGEVTIVVDAGLVPHAGRVVSDADGKPVAGARVEVVVGSVLGLASVATRATTDGEGRFEALVGAGTVTYHVDAAGFEPVRLTRSRPLDSPVELRVRRVARVQGRVTTEADGAPAPGIPVFARSDDGPLQGSAVSDATGRYEITAVSAGPLTVFAHGGGYTTKGLSAWRVGDGFNPFEVTVDPDATVTVDLVVVRAGAAKGKVVDAAGLPVVGATISTERIVPGGESDTLAFLGTAGAVATDEEGAFAFDTLMLDASYRFLAAVGRATQGRAGPLRVEAGRVVTVEIRLSPPRGGVIRCETPDTKPVPGANVYAYRQTEGRWDYLGTGATSLEGEARLGPLPPGPIYVYAQCQGHRTEGDNSTTIGSDPEDTSEITHTFVFKASASVAGVVRWAGGEPARGVQVEAKTERWNSSNWIGDDGAFGFEDVDEAGVDLKILDDDGETVLAQTRAKGGDQAVVVTLTKARPPAWRVRVVTADGRPVTSAILLVKGEDHEFSETVVDGRVELPVIDVPVTVLVYAARGLGFAPIPFGWVVAGPFPAKSETAEVRLPPEKVIAGVVKDGAGQPVRGVALWARPKELPEALGEVDDDVSWARTGPDGRFRIGRLSAGVHRIRISAPDSAGVMEPVEAPAGKTDLEITLATGREAPLTVLDADGMPVEGAIVFIDRPNARRVVDESDSAGVARPRGLDPEQRYDLRVEPPAARSDCLAFERKGWTPGDSPVTLPRGLAIRGTVRDASGRPVPRASVERLGPDGDAVQRATTGRDGTFALVRVPEGTVRVLARVPDEALAGPTVSLQAGAENVVLLVAPTVSLRVTIEGWRPVGQAWLRLVDEDGGRGTSWSTISDAGVVTLTGLRPSATYRVYQTWEVPNGPEVVVAKTGIRGDAAAVSIPAVEARRVSGKVVLPPGVGWWTVYARRDGATREASTEEDGLYTIGGLAEGTWTLDVQAQVNDVTWTAKAEVDAGATGVVLDPKPPP